MQTYQGIEDPSLPVVPKECLQQYDPYQIYDLYCLDRVVEVDNYEWRVRGFNDDSTNFYNEFLVKFSSSGTNTYFGTQLLAVQKYSPILISFDFDRLINRYVDIPILPSYVTCRYGTNRTDGGTPINPIFQPGPYETLAFSGNNGETGTTNYYRWTVSQTRLPTSESPNFFNLVTGYELDTRIKSKYIRFVASKTESISVSYFRSNPFEPIPNLTSVDWCIFDMDIEKGKTYFIDIDNIVFGTLSISSTVATQLINQSTTLANHYPFSVYFVDGDIALFAEWVSKYTQVINNLPTSPDFPVELNSVQLGLGYYGNFLLQHFYNIPIIFERSTYVVKPSILRKISANNNIWANNFSDLPDVNFQPNHPLFRVREQRAYNWHIKPQLDGSYGDLIMNSPEIKEIHAALNAKKWATNPDDPTKIRKDDLGWRLQRMNEVLGIRVKTDGTIDEPKEKKDNRREHAEDKEKNDPQEYNPNCFGSKGMLVRYLPNKFKPKGKDVETIEGGFRKVKDIPQLLAELHEQANAAMGYQEGTAIEITVDDETYRYPNQLALLTEIFVTLKQSGVYSKGAFFSSVVAEQSIKEVIGGLGLRTVDKYLEFKIAGKTAKLYYKGISASQSIRRKLSAISTNIGTIIGNIT